MGLFLECGHGFRAGGGCVGGVACFAGEGNRGLGVAMGEEVALELVERGEVLGYGGHASSLIMVRYLKCSADMVPRPVAW